MRLPIDTSAIAFLCALAPEPLVDFETRRPKADENGEPLYVIQLLAMGDGSADLLAVKVPGVPSQAIRQGIPVKVSGLVAQPWTMNDRSGVSFKAARVEPAVTQAKAREGAGAAAKRAAGPLHPPDRVRQHPALASGVRPHDANRSYCPPAWPGRAGGAPTARPAPPAGTPAAVTPTWPTTATASWSSAAVTGC